MRDKGNEVHTIKERKGEWWNNMCMYVHVCERDRENEVQTIRARKGEWSIMCVCVCVRETRRESSRHKDSLNKR